MDTAAQNVGTFFRPKNEKNDENEEKKSKYRVIITDRVAVVRGIGNENGFSGLREGCWGF